MLKSEEGSDYIYFKDACNWLVSNCLLQLKREVFLHAKRSELLCLNTSDSISSESDES